MSEVLDQVHELKQRVEGRERDRIRLEAERDAAKSHRDDALKALERFGVSSVEEAETRIAEMEVEIASEIEALAEALR